MVRTKEQSLKLFLTLKGSMKKKSLMMTLERLLSFIDTESLEIRGVWLEA